MNKKQIFAIKIAPLLEDVAALCDTYGIAMISTFSVGSAEEPNLFASGYRLDENGDMPENMKAAMMVAHGENPFGVEAKEQEFDDLTDEEVKAQVIALLDEIMNAKAKNRVTH